MNITIGAGAGARLAQAEAASETLLPHRGPDFPYWANIFGLARGTFQPGSGLMDEQLIRAELDDIARQLEAHADRYQALDLASLAERLRELAALIDGTEASR